ncbi:MAG: helix-hairpin-helix domain-containing protein [Thermoplasmata archaeon]|nr:helix-hairpin-helix domain-containing protein [Thermoplasmata archaeon]
MGTNADVAAIFREIADLLDLLGERFKPEAYRRAARSLEGLPEDLRLIAQRGELDAIPGVGEALRQKIDEYLTTGAIPYLAKLQAELPPGLVTLTRLPGLGPKTARRFWLELGIVGPTELTEAIAAGRLNGVKGFGPRKIELIRDALASASTPSHRLPLAEADRIAQGIVASLRSRAPLDAVEIAGSFRRCRETVGDLDVLVTSNEPEKVLDAFNSLPGKARQLMRGPTKATIVLEGELQVDLRVVAPEEFGAALQYFTGGKDHNVHLRSIARDRGLRINEYGVFRGEERVAGRTEEEVYATLGFPWIPPEIREDHGEIEAAAQGRLPHLVELGSLRGDLHVHLAPDASTTVIRSALAEASALGFEYVGFAVPLGEGAVPELARTIRTVPSERPRILLGAEVPSWEGASDPPDGFDYTIVTSPIEAGSSSRVRSAAKKSSRPPILFAHGSGGAPASAGRTPGSAGRSQLIASIVVGPDAPSRGWDSATLRGLAESGVEVALSADSPDGGQLDRLRLAVGLARRGWTTAATVTNARPWSARPGSKPPAGRDGPG